MAPSVEADRAGTPRRRTRLRRWLGAFLALAAVAAAAWFGWGALASSRFEARVAHLRAQGAIPHFLDGSTPPIEPERNGYALLKACADESNAIRDRFASGAEPRVKGWHSYGLDERPFPDWTLAQQRKEKRFLRAHEEVLAKLDEALTREVIQCTDAQPATTDAMLEVLWALGLCKRFRRAYPEARAMHVGRMLTILQRWRSSPGMVFARANIVQRRVLREVKALLEDDEPETFPSRDWRGALGGEGARLLEQLRWRRAWEHASAIWMLEHWRRGEDPMNTFGDDDADEVSDARAWLAELPIRAVVVPRHRSWWNRPLLHAFAHEVAALIPEQPPRPWSLEDLRRRVVDAAAEPEPTTTRVLDTLTMLRLARASLLAVHAIEQRGLDSPDPAALERMVTQAGLVDPCSGQPFEFDVRGSTIVIRPPQSPALDVVVGLSDDESDHLTWRIPWR